MILSEREYHKMPVELKNATTLKMSESLIASFQFLKTGDVLIVRVGTNSTAAGGRRRESEFVPRSAETKVVKPKVTAGNRKPA